MKENFEFVPIFSLNLRPTRDRPVTPTATNPRGFTLVELLIASVLVSVLMLAVWSLFRTWSGLYEKGQHRATQAQLVRSLCDQLAEDLHGAAAVGRPGRAPANPGSLAVVGDRDWLILEVMRTPDAYRQTLDAGEDSSARSETATIVAPEWQRIIYTFAPAESDATTDTDAPAGREADDTAPVEVASPLSDQAGTLQPFCGLLRVAVAREYFDQVAAERGSEFGRSGSAARGRAAGNVSVGEVPGVLEQDKVPEVAWLEFRYFDGQAWVGSWDSRSQGQVPVAVEVQFELVVDEKSAEETLGDDDSAAVTDEDMILSPRTARRPDDDPRLRSEGTIDSTPDGESRERVYHRYVVCLRSPPR